MYRTTIIVIALSLFILSETFAQPEFTSGANNKVDAPTIKIIKLDINDKTLELSYEIRNDSQQNVWLCDSVSVNYNFEVYPDEDGQTLIIRKRLGVPSLTFWQVQPSGKYIRLRPGQKRIESLFLTVPINCIYKYESRKQLQRIVNAKRLSI